MFSVFFFRQTWKRSLSLRANGERRAGRVDPPDTGTGPGSSGEPPRAVPGPWCPPELWAPQSRLGARALPLGRLGSSLDAASRIHTTVCEKSADGHETRPAGVPKVLCQSSVAKVPI